MRLILFSGMLCVLLSCSGGNKDIRNSSSGSCKVVRSTESALRSEARLLRRVHLQSQVTGFQFRN